MGAPQWDEEDTSNQYAISAKEAVPVDDPDIFWVAKLRKVALENGVAAQSMSPSKYVQEGIDNVNNYLQEKKPGHNHR